MLKLIFMKKSYIWFQSKLIYNISAEVLVGFYYSNTSNVYFKKQKSVLVINTKKVLHQKKMFVVWWIEDRSIDCLEKFIHEKVHNHLDIFLKCLKAVSKLKVIILKMLIIIFNI